MESGFTNIIQAQRRGLIPSDILDSSKYSNIFTELKQAYTKSKRLAEESLDEPMLSAIREREYALYEQNLNQKKGDINQVLQDSGLQETLNMAK